MSLLTRSPKLARVDLRWSMALKCQEGPQRTGRFGLPLRFTAVSATFKPF
jgi:hypothetical protein